MSGGKEGSSIRSLHCLLMIETNKCTAKSESSWLIGERVRRSGSLVGWFANVGAKAKARASKRPDSRTIADQEGKSADLAEKNWIVDRKSRIA
jgi:hypothetical protein